VNITEILGKLPSLSQQELDEVFSLACTLRHKFIEDTPVTHRDDTPPDLTNRERHILGCLEESLELKQEVLVLHKPKSNSLFNIERARVIKVLPATGEIEFQWFIIYGHGYCDSEDFEGGPKGLFETISVKEILNVQPLWMLDVMDNT
jgi:hypothetical protein